jgi:hypothetical protein
LGAPVSGPATWVAAARWSGWCVLVSVLAGSALPMVATVCVVLPPAAPLLLLLVCVKYSDASNSVLALCYWRPDDGGGLDLVSSD